MEEILKHIKSVCPDCKCKGHIMATRGNINICTRCNGKGYLTYEELVNEVKELGETKRQEKKEKRQRKEKLRQIKANKKA